MVELRHYRNCTHLFSVDVGRIGLLVLEFVDLYGLRSISSCGEVRHQVWLEDRLVISWLGVLEERVSAPRSNRSAVKEFFRGVPVGGLGRCCNWLCHLLKVERYAIVAFLFNRCRRGCLYSLPQRNILG